MRGDRRREPRVNSSEVHAPPNDMVSERTFWLSGERLNVAVVWRCGKAETHPLPGILFGTIKKTWISCAVVSNGIFVLAALPVPP